MDNDIKASITVTNTIESGAAFAIKHGTGETCYIPASVSYTSKVKPGAVRDAILIPNPNVDARDRTPYMVRYIPPDQNDTPPKPAPAYDPSEVVAYTKRVLRAGGVWTADQIVTDYTKGAAPDSPDYRAVRVAALTTMRKMFDEADCTKWVRFEPGKTVPSTEWYACHPENVDVDEWVDE